MVIKNENVSVKLSAVRFPDDIPTNEKVLFPNKMQKLLDFKDDFVLACLSQILLDNRY